MYSRFFVTVVFFSGLAAGWFANSWIAANHLNVAAFDLDTLVIPTAENLVTSTPDIYADNADNDAATVVVSANYPKEGTPEYVIDSQEVTEAKNSFNASVQDVQTKSVYELSAREIFSSLLEDRLYAQAIAFYAEQKQQRGTTAAQLKGQLLAELNQLSDAKNNNDFSELIESYLSIYYDDVEVLLLLADFNQSNGNYFEVVDAYLLAKTYAYSFADQENVINRFNRFVEVIDGSYTGQKNWPFLIEFYTHINTAGLLTSIHQYRQALVYLRSGDETYAVQQLNQLLNDSLVAKAAEKALNSLKDDSEIPVIINNSPLEGAESIALQKLGNQYAADLTNSREDSAKLLIDTGASMTALSRASFDRLNANGDAVEQGQRIFRTANGPVQGSVFSIPVLNLGSYVLEDTQVAVIDFDSSRGIDGLLGMNILGQFRFHIEQEKSRLLLSKK